MKNSISLMVERARGGDEQACAQLIMHKRSDILSLATKIMGNKHDGEDAAQEVSLIIRAQIKSLKSSDSFDSWVSRITYRVCFALKKKSKVSFSDITNEYDNHSLTEWRVDMLPLNSVIDDENKMIVDEYLDVLNEKQKHCVELFYYEGHSYAEISNLLGISKKELANVLDRARKKLRTLMDKERVYSAA